jgi:hypothetical protein
VLFRSREVLSSKNPRVAKLLIVARSTRRKETRKGKIKMKKRKRKMTRRKMTRRKMTRTHLL